MFRICNDMHKQDDSGPAGLARQKGSVTMTPLQTVKRAQAVAHSLLPAPPPFAAPSWLKSGHLQTLYAGTLWRPEPLPPYQCFSVAVDDSNRVLCEWNLADKTPQRACLVLIHGLGSSAQAAYMASAARQGLARGLDVVRMNLRGCGASRHLSQTLYHAGLTGDLLALCRHLSQELGYAQLVLAGFSLGGHQVLKLASERPDLPALQGVCAISPPLSLAAASRSIMHPANRIYERYYYQQMRRDYLQRRRWWPEHSRLSVLERVRNLWDFDDQITGPEFGFRDAADYYAQSSVLEHLHQIDLPTLVIHALDDPIILGEAHLQAMQKSHQQIHWLLTAEGGHVGFINHRDLARQDSGPIWSENRLLDFAQGLLEAAN